MMLIEILKPVGYKKPGEVYQYSDRKAKPLIAAGMAKEVGEKKEEKPKKKPGRPRKAKLKAETAELKLEVEKAEFPPEAEVCRDNEDSKEDCD